MSLNSKLLVFLSTALRIYLMKLRNSFLSEFFLRSSLDSGFNLVPRLILLISRPNLVYSLFLVFPIMNMTQKHMAYSPLLHFYFLSWLCQSYLYYLILLCVSGGRVSRNEGKNLATKSLSFICPVVQLRPTIQVKVLECFDIK